MMFLKPFIFYLVTALFGLAFALVFPFAESYWLVLSILAAFYLANTQIVPQTNPSFICVGLVIALLVALSGYLAGWHWVQAVFLLLTIMATAAIGVWQPRYWRVVFITNYLLILAAAIGVGSTEALQRYFYVACGFMLVAGMRWIMFHSSTTRQLKWFFANCLMKAAALSDTMFAVYLARDYQEKLFVYEKKLHWQRNAFLISLTTLRNVLRQFKHSKRADFVKLLHYVEQLYEILLAIGLLGYRVTDHTTFEVANKEILALGEGVAAYLKALAAQLSRGSLVVPVNFSESITELQDINNDALIVVAPDPMVFILFIQDFYALHELFTQMIEVIDEVQRK
jgi:hypothetical protein